MGVGNLIGFVNNATTVTHISENDLPKSIAAVDVSHWIYKACYSCPEALYHRTNMVQVYKVILNFIEERVQMLKYHDVQLIFVFDGMKLPAKQITHQKRAAQKAEARLLVEKLLAQNNSQEARKHMFQCVEIKFDVVQQVIDYCKREGIKYYVAPYEADAQLAFLNNNNLCDYVITEDSDLILYGCNKIVYKLEKDGKCVLYERSRLGRCFGLADTQVDFVKFRRMCILSGCDYLKNLHGVGLQTAKKFFLMTRQDNLRLLLPKLATYLKKKELAGKVTEEYIQGFINAETTFKHHIVYDPTNQTLRPLEPYPRGHSSSDYPMAGKRFHSVMAKDLVKGLIDLDSINPEVDLDSASDDSSCECADDEADLHCREINLTNGGVANPTKLKAVA